MLIRKRLLTLILLGFTTALPALAIVKLKQMKQEPNTYGSGEVVPLPPVCGESFSKFVIDGKMPVDVEGALMQPNHNVVQRAADIFSWQEFLAVNWPAKERDHGESDFNKNIGGEGPRLWETWKSQTEVYLPDGSEPTDWNSSLLYDGSKDAGQFKKLTETSANHFLYEVNQADQVDETLPPILTDARGSKIRYEVRMNKIMFDFIRKNRLYNGKSQAAISSVTFPNGGILIKAAWREIEPAEAARFVTAKAYLYDYRNGRPLNVRTHLVGLIGFHIVQKTPSAPQWIWSTFEQVDNLHGSKPSFKTISTGKISHKSNLNRQTKAGRPTIVSRLTLIPNQSPNCDMVSAAQDNVRDLNQAMQEALHKEQSPLQYYELVGTQWPVKQYETANIDTEFAVQPPIAANTTMETFAQETSSCMGCHAMARTSNPDKFVSSDFTFSLSNAKPVIPNLAPIPPPVRPKTEWDRANWGAVMLGKKLTEQTYELLPQNVTAKLHCGSCHMDAGRNPTSAWWVGMYTKYPTLEKLQGRVNQCFERSMNGNEISSVETESNLADDAPEMNAFLMYMKWMDEQFAASHTNVPHTGLTLISATGLPGDSYRGAAIFLQKCASCHGAEGKGRYEHNTYFRPALWGASSFNNLAGMDKPEKVSAFLSANMPYGSGGELTDQECWDLTAFLHSKPRPTR